tara:strand:- start:1253 stop:2254 length:1002 start_codon:yes stop_codon:yes gene_type:complete
MPPLYPFFLYSIKLIAQEKFFYEAIFIFQVLFSILSTLFLFKILRKFYSKKISYIFSLIFTLIPMNIYSATQFSSINLQVLFTILFIFFLVNLSQSKNLKDLFLFSFLSGLLILLRGEFFLFYFLTLSFLFYKTKDIKLIFISLIFCLLVISPYLIRNYKTFESVTITKSFGYNLWRGNNERTSVEGYVGKYDFDRDLKNKIEKIKDFDKYDLIVDDYYKDAAIANIKKDPSKYLFLYVKKFFSFIFFDLNSTYPNYYNIFHIIPKLFLSVTTLVGIFLLAKTTSFINFFSILYFSNIALFSIFFILPRYSLALLPLQIIISAYVLKKLKPNF